MLTNLNKFSGSAVSSSLLGGTVPKFAIPARTKRNLATVKQMLAQPKYSWATNSFVRHVIFNAEDRVGSGGALVPGNGLAPAIFRIGRKVLIDLDVFDQWIERHRMTSQS